MYYRVTPEALEVLAIQQSAAASNRLCSPRVTPNPGCSDEGFPMCQATPTLFRKEVQMTKLDAYEKEVLGAYESGQLASLGKR